MNKSYVHLYTGNGKGKTTAAFGQALRAALAGMNVYIGQFIKGMKYHETQIDEYLDNITIEQYGEDCLIEREPDEEDLKRAQEGLKKIKEVLESGKYDMVILDEITIALYFKLINVKDLIDVIDNRDPKTEVVLTGRYAPKKLIEYGDLVTEMKEIKHYYTKGVGVRSGIEN